jgi:hypothetical protein
MMIFKVLRQIKTIVYWMVGLLRFNSVKSLRGLFMSIFYVTIVEDHNDLLWFRF